MGDFIGEALNTIGAVIGSIYDWIHVFLPGPILPVVLGGLVFAGAMWFMFKR